MKIIVCGGRKYWNREHVYETLDVLYEKHPDLIVVTGKCRTGADRVAMDWRTARDCQGRDHAAENDVVLDNVAGSGTTAIACENTGRHWICIEQDWNYANLANERIEEWTLKACPNSNRQC